MDNEMVVRELESRLQAREREISESKELLSSAALINSTLNLHQVLDYLMELAKRITGAEGASALLLEEERLCFVAASGVKSAEVRKVYLDRGEGIAGWVVEHGEHLLVRDVAADARFSRKADDSSGFFTRSVLAVPLKLEERIIGVVEAVNKRGNREFSDGDVRLLSTLADSAAMAIQKARLYADLNDLFLSTIKAITNAIEAKDPYTRGHSERIREFSLVIARELGLSEVELKDIEIAALLHDVGKIGVSETVLRKVGRLTDEEFSEIRRHPVIGADMLASIKQLRAAIPGIRYHQERFDGKGYPDGLRGESIPFYARIIAVADAFDAMTSNRPYQVTRTHGEALAEIEKCSGMHFDPRCVEAMLSGYGKGLIIGFGQGGPQQGSAEVS